MTATNDSISIPPYPMSRASLSRRSILGVVPLETRAWNPLMAPQAIVMNAKGKSFPAKTGPVPSTKRVSAGSLSGGSTSRIPTAIRRITPIFMKVER
jgi:hypothetical protein